MIFILDYIHHYTCSQNKAFRVDCLEPQLSSAQPCKATYSLQATLISVDVIVNSSPQKHTDEFCMFKNQKYCFKYDSMCKVWRECRHKYAHMDKQKIKKSDSQSVCKLTRVISFMLTMKTMCVPTRIFRLFSLNWKCNITRVVSVHKHHIITIITIKNFIVNF